MSIPRFSFGNPCRFAKARVGSWEVFGILRISVIFLENYFFSLSFGNPARIAKATQSYRGTKARVM